MNISKKLKPGARPLKLDGQEAYCQEYIRTFNKTASYKAGHPNASDASAAVEGCRYLRKPKIWERIAYLLAKHHPSWNSNRKSVKQKMVDLMCFSPLDIIRWDDEGKPQVLAAGLVRYRELIQEVKVDNNGTIQIKAMSKDKALEMLAKIEKLLVEHHELSGEMILKQQEEANKAYEDRLAKLRAKSK